MARNPGCSVYVGNLDEKVTDRILYELLIQVGRIVNLYMPLDKETNRHKGYAFVEYETEEIAEYAIRLFSGLVRLNGKTVRISMSGQDKPTQNNGTPVTPMTNSGLVRLNGKSMSGQDKLSQNNATPVTPKTTNSTALPRPHYVHGREVENFHGLSQLTDSRASAYAHQVTPVSPVPNSAHLPRPFPPHARETAMFPESPVPSAHLPRPFPPHARETAMFPDSPGSIDCRFSAYTHSSPGYHHQAYARGFVDNGVNSGNFDYSSRVVGSTLSGVNRSDFQHPAVFTTPYPRHH